MQRQHVYRWLLITLMLFSMAPGAYAAQDQAATAEPLPDIFIPFDTGSTPEYVLVVEKATQTLRVYEYNGKPREIHRFKCSTGKKVGAKARSGDSRTPEGIYFFIKKHEDKQLAPIYGIMAFPTDYPNLMDRIAERTGSAIWLHGTNKELKPRDSNGCIVLDNADLKTVAPYISLNRTPIIVTDRLSHESFEAKAPLKPVILSLVSAWGKTLANGTYHDYVNFYDADYVPDISWWTEWNRIKKQLRSGDQPLTVTSEKVAIFRHKEIYVVLFDLFIRFSDHSYPVGTKKFFLSQKDNRFRIIGENYQTFPGAKGTDRRANPFLLASRQLTIPQPEPAAPAEAVAIVENSEEIEKIVADWLRAWSSKDIGKYGAYYAQDFRSQGMNKKAWLSHKKRLNRKYRYIRVTQRNLVAKPDNNNIRVSFVQKYESSALKAVGVKQLLLKRENGQWKIYRETWRKL